MEHDNLTERLDAATSLLERTLTWLEERGAAAAELAGEVGKISATIEQSRREAELTEKLAAAERESNLSARQLRFNPLPHRRCSQRSWPHRR